MSLKTNLFKKLKLYPAGKSTSLSLQFGVMGFEARSWLIKSTYFLLYKLYPVGSLWTFLCEFLCQLSDPSSSTICLTKLLSLPAVYLCSTYLLLCNLLSLSSEVFLIDFCLLSWKRKQFIVVMDLRHVLKFCVSLDCGRRGFGVIGRRGKTSQKPHIDSLTVSSSLHYIRVKSFV